MRGLQILVEEHGAFKSYLAHAQVLKHFSARTILPNGPAR
jgi:hypothetical protein